jgi:hypothetical protein
MKKPLRCTPRPSKKITKILCITQTVRLETLFILIFAGAAVYIAVEEFDKSIMDSDRAIELNKNYVKVCSLPEFPSLISFDGMITNELKFRLISARHRH